MIRPPRFRHLSRVGARLCALLASIGYVAAATGLHLPIVLTKDTSKPFPCMHSRCGCEDAEQCWKSCCCHTASERLAWARARRVAPPKDLIRQVTEQTRALHGASVAACCRSKTACAVAEKATRPAATKLCTQAACEVTPSATCAKCVVKVARSNKTCRSSERNDVVSIVDALKCRGAGSTVSGLLPAVPLTMERWSPIEVCCGWICVSCDSLSIFRPDLLLKPPIV
jgi:hypothetical protein